MESGIPAGLSSLQHFTSTWAHEPNEDADFFLVDLVRGHARFESCPRDQTLSRRGEIAEPRPRCYINKGQAATAHTQPVNKMCHATDILQILRRGIRTLMHSFKCVTAHLHWSGR